MTSARAFSATVYRLSHRSAPADGAGTSIRKSASRGVHVKGHICSSKLADVTLRRNYFGPLLIPQLQERCLCLIHGIACAPKLPMVVTMATAVAVTIPRIRTMEAETRTPARARPPRNKQRAWWCTRSDLVVTALPLLISKVKNQREKMEVRLLC